MKRNIYFFFKEPLYILMFFFCGSQHVLSADDLPHLSADEIRERFDSIDISLLTCQPHDEVYSLYGHTAIRMHDGKTGEDIAINYGVFDPTIKLFALHFIFGLTDYSMGICSYADFLADYKRYGCGVYEQHIDMNVNQKAAFIKALAENALPENTIYRYNFFYNNCTTKARDIILESIAAMPLTGNISDTGGAEIVYRSMPPIQQGERTFRDLVHMKAEGHPWTSFGNDLLLGVGADRNTSFEQREFLPEVLSVDFDSANVVFPASGYSRHLVDTAYWALAPGKPWKNPNNIDFPFTPTQVAVALLLLCILYFGIFEGLVIKRSVLWIHYSYICLYAFVGIVLFLMLFSQHPTVRVNFQIFIFNPIFFIFALPRYIVRWGKYAILASLAIFFLGNIFQCYAEGVNILGVALLVTFLPILFCKVKKI